MNRILLLIFILSSIDLKAQKDQYDQFKIQYDSLRKVESHEGALLVAKQMNTWALEYETDTSLRYAVSFRYLGNCYNSMQIPDSAFFFYNNSLSTLIKQNRSESTDAANCHGNLGLLYKKTDRFKEAEENLLKYLEIIEKIYGKEHEKYSFGLNNLGNLYQSLGQYSKAENYYLESLEIKKKSKGEKSPDYAMSLYDLGNLYETMGDYKAAEPYYKQSLEIRKQALGEGHPDYATSLTDLGILYFNMGDYKAVEPYFKQALEIRKQALGERHPDYASSLMNLGLFYSEMGDYKAAVPFYKQSVEILKKALGEGAPYYASSINNLGTLCLEMGDYKAAEPYYKQALEIRKQALGEWHPDYAKSLHNLGFLYSEMGDYKAAEPYYKLALEIFKKVLGEGHPDYANCLNSLGNLYADMGDYKAAEPYRKQVLEIRKQALGEGHPDYAKGLLNLGNLYAYMADYKAAEPYFKQALEIFKQALGDRHPNYASSLNSLGFLCLEMGDYKAAEPYFKQALEIRKQALGEGHPDYAMSLYDLGTLYLEMGNFNAAELYFNRAIKVKINNLSINFCWISAQEKQAYWQQEKHFYDNMNSFSVSAVDFVPFSTELSYNANLISKSLLLETSRELDQAIAQSSDVEMKAEFAEMKQFRKLFSKMQSEGSTNKEIMERYKSQADSLDKILVNKLGEYAASKRKFEITWKDVQSNLTTTDAAIEFARYYDDKDSLYKYMALVVRPDYEYPKLISLGEEDVIRTAAQNKDFSTLYNEAWKGIDSLLVEVKRVYYSPAGELNNVSFSALCTEEGNELVASNKEKNRGVVIGNNKTTTKACNSVLMDKYELHQLTTTRYLADGTLKKEKPMQPSLELVGGINFDDIPEKTIEADKEQSNEDFAFHANLNKRTASTNGKKRGKRSSSNYGKNMEPLPGTKEEVTNIANLLMTSNWEVQTKSDKKAGEYEFKKDLETKVPGVLHIATHGFAFPDELKKETNLLDLNQTSTYKVSEDPMVRCGLLLSGANISWMGNPQKMIEQTGDDGILTAAEVANLDLSKTKLVVLSACETGLGKIEGSEGTFGLKRGFKLAGVEQIIVSLWSVPDKETMELMTLFYTDLTKTLNPVISFSKAQKEMRNKYPTDPEKWAGFVLVR